ncbi:MAG TPA: proline dehydrogenase family protein [Solirubrobacteraceae bacterium]|nr:proline dehydrogenase family protein [Solirubrobacteraceae bacterium]
MASQRITAGRERRGLRGRREVSAPRPDDGGAAGASQPAIETIGRSIWHALPAHRGPAAALDRRLDEALARRADVRAALFRLVDVAPACDGPADVARHLTGYLADLDAPPRTIRALAAVSRSGPGARAVGAAGALGVKRVARRFIAGESPADARVVLRQLWSRGVASSVDLLGEASVTSEEADAYAARCDAAIRMLRDVYAGTQALQPLDRDSRGMLPRANLSVKVSALTPLLDPAAPARAIADAKPRLRALLRAARDEGAHLHVDSEAFDTCATVVDLALELLGEPEFRDGPSAGVVLQAYLRESPAICARLIEWAQGAGRSVPLTVRLVKGAYWDHELVEAAQLGWTPPVYTEKAASDRSFESLTGELLRARPSVRVAVASHNLRSIAHAVALSRSLGGADADVEIQVLRGLGDDLAAALVAVGLRARMYCPVGDLVSGMAYLVRRLLENTSNESFLAAQAHGVPLDELLRAP